MCPGPNFSYGCGGLFGSTSPHTCTRFYQTTFLPKLYRFALYSQWMRVFTRRCRGELAPPTLCAADPSGGPRLSHWGLPSDPVMPPSSRWDSLRTCPLSRRKQSFPVVQRRPRLTAGTHPPSQARAGLSGRTSPMGPCTCPLSLPRACPQAPSFPGASIQVGPPVTPAPQHRCASGTPPQAWRHASR